MTGSRLGSTATATAAPGPGATDELRAVIEGRAGSSGVHRFLTDRAHTLLAAALHQVLPAGVGPVRSTITRSKLKPHRKLTVYGRVSVADLGGRSFAASWSLQPHPQSEPTHPADPVVDEGIRAPFRSLRVSAHGAGMTVLVSPLDPAFPQLARLHDPAHLGRLLTSAGLGAQSDAVSVTPVRYRPGQRHVLRVDADGHRPSLYAKCYRDDTGARAVRDSVRLAAALARCGGPAATGTAAAYIESERLVLWQASEGTPLSRTVARTPELAATAGAALRAIHDDPVSGDGTSRRSEPAAEARATMRSCEHIMALAPELAEVLSGLVERATAMLEELPPEQGHLLHGDYKCDNILVEGHRLRLLDFDRVTVGDPALDLGKLCADLRWWALAAGVRAEPVVAALLAGYGPCPPTRLQRAGHYDVLFQVRAAGRRVPLHEAGWPERVEMAIRTAGLTSEALT